MSIYMAIVTGAEYAQIGLFNARLYADAGLHYQNTN